ncbi:hypothetical protein [Thermoanaerobacter pentosaceus]|uniref:Flagellin Flp1-like domain-containing protein n=1 Tax=Thermoanaerobacter pentosaceus TaxID=694059 RepID=A0ABT9M2I3_9THEO|nr:hypothetical protein [Thermoanaerobacter pentosaceus]MDP9750344.1 hypothetical protein [Thermoanaerobacter pentosaceus]
MNKLLARIKKGSAEIIGFIILIVFIAVVAAPSIKTLGQTVKAGVDSTNTQVTQTIQQ